MICRHWAAVSSVDNIVSQMVALCVSAFVLGELMGTRNKKVLEQMILAHNLVGRLRLVSDFSTISRDNL